MSKNNLGNVIPLMQNIQHHLQSNAEVQIKLSNTMKELASFFGADMAVSYISIDENYLELFSSYGLDTVNE